MMHYLSGPMTGYPDHNFPTFRRACEILRADGLHVVSPHEKCSEADGNRTWHDFLREDIALLLTCDAIIMLPGWPTSKGAQLELNIALSLGMHVYFYSTDARGLTRMGASCD